MSQVPKTTESPTEEEIEEHAEEVDYQVPENNVDEKNLHVSGEEHALVNQTGNTGTHEIEFEAQAVIDRIAEDTYDRDDVAIRELIANGETACKQAKEIAGDDYTPSIELELTKGETLRIYDNGIGIKPAVFDQVLRHIARSTNRDDGDVSGQMGMGVFSVRNIIEDGASCTITTRSRETEDEYKMYMHDNGFDPIPGGFEGDGRYGTMFEIPLKDSFGEHSVRSAVKKYAEFTDVQVLLTIFDSDGNQIYQEDYKEKNLEDAYDDDAFVYTYEDEFVKVVGSKKSGAETLLVNMPIGRNDPQKSYTDTAKRHAKHPWDLKIKKENGAIWIGEDEDGNDLSGLVPVPPNDYESMSPERKEMHISEEDVPDTAVTLPEPTSDRDRLSRGNLHAFYDKASMKVRDAFYESLEEIMEDVDDKEDLFQKARDEPNEFNLMMYGMKSMKHFSHDTEDYIEHVEEKTGVALTEEVVDAAEFLRKDVELAHEDRGDPALKEGRDKKEIREVITGMDSDGEVYMGKSINALKARVVWDLNSDNQVVRLNTRQHYEDFEEMFGWKYLKEITISEVEDDLSDSLQELVKTERKSNAGLDAEERMVTLRKSSSTTAKKTVAEITKGLTDAHSDSNREGVSIGYSYNIDTLIIFPPDTEESITNWYNFVAEAPGNVGIATVSTKMVAEYLTEHSPDESIMHIDDITSDAEEIEVTTTEGDVKLGEEEDRLVLHTVRNEDLLDAFKEDDVMESMQTWLESDEFARNFASQDDDTDTEDPLYAPVPREGALTLKAGLKNLSIPVIDPYGAYKFSDTPYNNLSGKNSAVLYVKARFSEWDNSSPEMKVMIQGAAKSGVEATLNIVEMMSKFHDAGIDPVSQEPGKVDFTVNGQQASLGETVLREAPVPADD